MKLRPLLLCAALAGCAHSARPKPPTAAEFAALQAENAKLKALPKPGDPGRQDIFTHSDTPPPAPESAWTRFTSGLGPLGTLVGAVGTSAANITTAALSLAKY